MYLIKIETYFYDPHGSPDLGSTIFQVSDDSEYDGLKEGVQYIGSEYDYENEGLDEDGNEVLYVPLNDKIESRFYAEDGYNFEVEFIYVKKITEEEAVKYRRIIREFDSLGDLF